MLQVSSSPGGRCSWPTALHLRGARHDRCCNFLCHQMLIWIGAVQDALIIPGEGI